MKYLTIICLLCALGSAYSGLVSSEGVKTAKYTAENQSSETKVASPGKAIHTASSSSIYHADSDVVPGKAEARQYVPVIPVVPVHKVEWVAPLAKKQYTSDEVVEQVKEEPGVVSSYDSVIRHQTAGEVPADVLSGKRRLGEEDASVAKAPGHVQESVPQHVYTEDSFPSLITLKGRQYWVLPHRPDTPVSPHYAPAPLAYPSSGPVHSDQFSPFYKPSYYLATVGDVTTSYRPVAVGQTLTGQSVGSQPVPSSAAHQSSPSVQSEGLVVVQSPVSHQVIPSQVVVQSPLSPVVSQVSPSHVSVGSQSTYYVVASKPSQSPVNQPAWGWVSAPQYVTKPGSWVVKGVKQGGSVTDAPVQYAPAKESSIGDSAWTGPVGVGGQWESPSVKPTSGKKWYIYSPTFSGSWSHGAAPQSVAVGQRVYAWAPQYGPQWYHGESEPSSQWYSSVVSEEGEKKTAN